MEYDVIIKYDFQCAPDRREILEMIRDREIMRIKKGIATPEGWARIKYITRIRGRYDKLVPVKNPNGLLLEFQSLPIYNPEPVLNKQDE